MCKDHGTDFEKNEVTIWFIDELSFINMFVFPNFFPRFFFFLGIN